MKKVIIKSIKKEDYSFIKPGAIILSTDIKHPEQQTVSVVTDVWSSKFKANILASNDSMYKYMSVTQFTIGSTKLEHTLFNGTITIEQ